MLEILYEDPDLLVVKKPAGLESQSVHSFEPDMVSLLRNYTGGGYIGVVHRLDKPVQGLMVYARTPSAAAGLSRQLQQGRFRKVYKAVVCGRIVDNVGNFVDYLLKDPRSNRSKIVEKGTAGAKRAELRYQVLSEAALSDGPVTLVRVELLTGRHHQIRAQFAGRGFPLWGDARYNPAFMSRGTAEQPALCACRLSFDHPVSGRPMSFSMEPEGRIWQAFKSDPDAGGGFHT